MSDRFYERQIDNPWPANCDSVTLTSTCLHSDSLQFNTSQQPSLVAQRSATNYKHSASKNDSDVAHYNFEIDQPILIIFGRDVAETVFHQRVICRPTFHTKCLCTTWENTNPENCVISVMLYTVSR